MGDQVTILTFMTPNEVFLRLKTIKRNEYDLHFLINFICLRPQMLVGNRDIKTVGAFIDGFAFSNETFSTELKNFTEWLSKRFNTPNNIAWWNTLERPFPNSEDALKELPILFEEFMQSRDFEKIEP